MPKKIIAIIGLPGSGKTETIEYLIKKYGWPKVYFGEVTFDEMKKRGLEINEKNEKTTREELRKNFGLDYYAKKTIEKIEKIDSPVVLVESLYSWIEYQAFLEKYGDDFLTIAVYSSPKTRYDRLANRAIRPLTAEDAKGRDYAQIINLTQANPIAMANYTIINEKNGIDHLRKKIDEIIEQL